MTINEAYRKGIGILKNAGIEAPVNDAGVIMCHVLKCDRAFLYSRGADELEENLLKIYFDLLEQRASKVPLQHITGFQEFMSLPFEVGRNVLIPRQDTEILVETVINLCKKNRHERVDILDVGTGSGCIAVSLAYYIPRSFVTAVDIKPEALAVARKNAAINGVSDRIRFVKSNLFDNLDGEKFDFIVSNPPYIRSGDIESLQDEVKCHEPLAALDGGIDGLDFYRAIVSKAPDFLKEEGMLVFETGYDQAYAVKELMKDYFMDIEIKKDLAGIDRVVTGTLMPPDCESCLNKT